MKVEHKSNREQLNDVRNDLCDDIITHLNGMVSTIKWIKRTCQGTYPLCGSLEKVESGVSELDGYLSSVVEHAKNKQ